MEKALNIGGPYNMNIDNI